MKTKYSAATALSIAIVMIASAIGVFASFDVGNSAVSNTNAKTKPVVVIVKAEWCSACQKLEPTMMELMNEYGNRIDFVVLDVTTEESTARAEAKARSMGLGAFFDENKRKTATVAVFKGKTEVFKTMKNFNRSDYVAAFDKALAKN